MIDQSINHLRFPTHAQAFKKMLLLLNDKNVLRFFKELQVSPAVLEHLTSIQDEQSYQ